MKKLNKTLLILGMGVVFTYGSVIKDGVMDSNVEYKLSGQKVDPIKKTAGDLQYENRGKTDKAAKDKESLKKAAIAAAMERVKAKKATSDTEPQNTDNLTPAQKQLIEEADKRRQSGKE